MEEHNEVAYVTQLSQNKRHILASLISIVLHPMFMNVYGILLLFIYTAYGTMYQNMMTRFIYPVLIFSCIIPGVGTYLLKKGGYVSSLSLNKRSERSLPLMVAFFGYLCQYIYFYNTNISVWFLNILMIPVVMVLVCYFINKYWKISIHMAAMGSLVGVTLSICYSIAIENYVPLFMLLFSLSGILGTARLYNNRHTPAEVYVGFLIGFVVSSITILLSFFLLLL